MTKSELAATRAYYDSPAFYQKAISVGRFLFFLLSAMASAQTFHCWERLTTASYLCDCGLIILALFCLLVWRSSIPFATGERCVRK